MLRNRLEFIDDRLFARAMDFCLKRGKLMPQHQMLQKLTILDFVVPLLGSGRREILEIGAGLGVHSALLSYYGRVSSTELKIPGSFVGADGEVQRIRQSVFAELGTGEIRFDHHDGRRLPYPDQSFDVVFHNSVIEHVPDIDAFNAEVFRVLKPDGICICITGTPALCRFRLAKHYFLRMPILLCMVAMKEAIPHHWLKTLLPRLLPIIRAPASLSQKIIDRLTRIDQRLASLSTPAVYGASHEHANINVRDLYSRMYHYIYFPLYNQVVLEKAATDYGLTTEQLLTAAHRHFSSAKNRISFDLTPVTHGQHYRDVHHEMTEWRLERWTQYFRASGFRVEQITGYRYHHVFEVTPSASLNARLYFRAARAVHGWIRRKANKPERASEIILLARRPAASAADTQQASSQR